MLKHYLMLLFLLIFQDVISEAKSKNATNCDGDPPVTIEPKTCCNIPQIIPTDVINCYVDETEANNPLSCVQQNCIFKHHKLINSKEEIQKENFRSLLNKWAERHSIWRNAANKAKARCLDGPIPITDNICEASKHIYCISGTLYEFCPIWNYANEECKVLRRYMNECYFQRPH